MTTLTRRTALTAFAAAPVAAVAALPAVAFTSADERIEHHLRELEKALCEFYGADEVYIARIEPTDKSRPWISLIPLT